MALPNGFKATLGWTNSNCNVGYEKLKMSASSVEGRVASNLSKVTRTAVENPSNPPKKV
jgi:hypothetical protein